MLPYLDTYRYLSSRSVNNAWKLSGLGSLVRGVVLYFTKVFVLVWGFVFVSDSVIAAQEAQAVLGYHQEKARQDLDDQRDELEGLRGIAETCLTNDPLGKPIKIGDNWYFCGLVRMH